MTVLAFTVARLLRRRSYRDGPPTDVVGRLRGRAITWLGTVAFVAVVAAGSASAAQGSLQRVAVGLTETVPPNQLGFANSHCPPSHPYPVGPDFSYLTGGGMPGSAALMASYPLPRRGWFTEVANLTTTPQRLNIGVLCLRAKARFAYPLKRNWVIPANGYGGGSSRCPRSAPHAIDNYFGIQSVVGAGSLLLADTYPFASGNVEGSETGVENRSDRTVGIFAGSVCTSLRSKTSYVRDRVASGQQSAPSHYGAHVRLPSQSAALFMHFRRLRPEIRMTGRSLSTRRPTTNGPSGQSESPASQSTP